MCVCVLGVFWPYEDPGVRVCVGCVLALRGPGCVCVCLVCSGPKRTRVCVCVLGVFWPYDDPGVCVLGVFWP